MRPQVLLPGFMAEALACAVVDHVLQPVKRRIATIDRSVAQARAGVSRRATPARKVDPVPDSFGAVDRPQLPPGVVPGSTLGRALRGWPRV